MSDSGTSQKVDKFLVETPAESGALVGRCIDAILSHPVRVAVILFVFVALSISGLRYLQFSTDYRVFFGGGDRHLEEFTKQQKIYAHNDSVLIAIEPNTDKVFNYDFLKTIRQYTHESWRLPQVTRVDSLTNFQDSFAEGNHLVIQNLVREGVSFDQALLDYVEKISLSEPALKNRLVSANGKYTGIALTVHLPEGSDKNEKIIAVVKQVRALAEQLRAEPSVKEVYLSGTVMINNAFYEVSKKDLSTLIPIMFLVIIVFLVLLLKSKSATLVVFSMVGVAVSISFGLGSLLGIELTPPSSAAAPIIMMLSIADSIHLLLGYYKNYHLNGGDKTRAMKASLDANFTPITLTTVTTVIGFLTMNFSESPPFHDLGNLVAIGSVAAYVLTIVLLPIVMVRLPAAQVSGDSKLVVGVEALGRWVLKNRMTLVALTFTVVGALIFGISRNTMNDEFVKYFDKSITFRTDNDFITENLTGIYQIEYSLPAADKEGVNHPEYLAAIEAFADWFRQQAHVMHVQSVADVYKKAHMNLMDGAVEEYRVPDTQAMASQSLLAYEMSLPFGLDLNDQINVSKSASKFVVSLQTVSAQDLVKLENAADKWLAENAPEYMVGAIGTGPAVLFSHIGIRSIRSGLIGGVVALLLISALLSIVFRSVKIGLLSIIPNLFPAAMAFGLWGVINGQINMALATVLSMTLGIVVDDTIHFISKYRRSIKQGLDPEQAIMATFSSVGVAIVVTTIVLVAGFIVLTFSPFVMNWGMGLLSSITIVFALFTDLLLLPAFLVQFEKKHDEVILPDSVSA